jgi:hypothetical protein
MQHADKNSPEAEQQFHQYTSNRIPWYVRAIWIGFWIFAVYYTVKYLFPDLQIELLRHR